MGLKGLLCLWICVLSCGVGGNHLFRGGQFGTVSSAASSAASGASSSAAGASSSAWSSAGSGFRRVPNLFPSSTRRRGSQRGANLGNVVLISPFGPPSRGRTPVTSGRRSHSPRILVSTRRRRPVVSSGRVNVVDLTGHRNVGTAPPGVQFVGGSGHGSLLLGGHSPAVNFIVQGHSPGILPSNTVASPGGSPGGGVLFVDGRNVGSVPSYGNLGNSAPLPTGPVQPFALDATAVGANIPGTSNKLTIQGQTTTGDLVLNGPGGTITIGAEILNGISRAGHGMRMTEFEEMEVEPPPGGGRIRGANGLKVTSTRGQSVLLHGKETLVPPLGIPPAASGHAGVQTAGRVGGVAAVASPLVLGGAGGNLGRTSSSSSSSSSASARAGSVQASASSSASANAIVLDSNANTSKSVGGAGGGVGGGASGSASSGTILVRSGSGKNERVLQLGQTDGKAQVITLGSGTQGIQVGQGGSGIQVPGNATVIIGG